MTDFNTSTLGALFDEYEKTSAITVLSQGKHTLEIASCTVKNNGVVPVYKILEGPETGQRAMAGGIFPGETEGGRNAFFRKLEKMGLGKDFFAVASSVEDIAKALIGRVVTVHLGVTEWQGEPRNELGFDIKLESAPPLPSFGGVPTVANVNQEAPASTPSPEPTPTPAPAPVVTPAAAAAPPITPDSDPGF